MRTLPRSGCPLHLRQGVSRQSGPLRRRRSFSVLVLRQVSRQGLGLFGGPRLRHSKEEEMLTLDHRLRPHPDTVDTELDSNEVVLLQLDRKLYFSLNRTGLRVWQGVKQGASLRDISASLQREFAVEPQRADSSVLRIAGELSREKLVEPLES